MDLDVSVLSDSIRPTLSGSSLKYNKDRRLLTGKPNRSSETLKLECPRSGQHAGYRRLQHMLKKFRSQIFFFMKMKLNCYKMGKCYKICGFQNGIVFPTEGM